jgi:hypothetical protein
MIELEGVAQQPFEDTPGRVHLDGGLQRGIMGKPEIGVAAANVCDDHAVLSLKPRKELIGVVRIRDLIRHILWRGNLGMTRAVQRLALVPVVDVSVAANRGVGRPLISREADEPARRVELGRQRVELPPEAARDLEVVALVPNDIEMGPVAAVGPAV